MISIEHWHSVSELLQHQVLDILFLTFSVSMNTNNYGLVASIITSIPLSAMFRKFHIINYFNNNTGSEEEATAMPYYTRHLTPWPAAPSGDLIARWHLVQHTPVRGQLIMERTTLQTLILQTHGVIRHPERPAR
jgi:hypothetical protein